MTGNTHVPDKLHAFTLQVRHMMCELISVDIDKVVSVEALDDVATESGGRVVAEQIKSVQSNNNPVANRAEAFWKTLNNWTQYVRDGNLKIENTTFRLIIISNCEIIKGILPELFNETDTIDKARCAIQKAKDTLWGINGEYKANRPKTYSGYLDVLFDGENSLIVEKIIVAMEIVIYSSDYDLKLYKKFCGMTIPLEYANDLFKYMLGWVYECVNSQTKNGDPAYISCKDFRNTLVTQIRRYNQNTTLAWATTKPSKRDTQHELERQDIYLKQLGLIQLDISDKMQAASDYLRTSAEKTKLAEKGIIAPQSFDGYYESLTNMWKNQKHLVMLSASTNSINDGQRIYYQCQEVVRNIKMQGMDTPESFGSGTLHTLANEPQDEPKIGWHRAYKELLRTGMNADE